MGILRRGSIAVEWRHEALGALCQWHLLLNVSTYIVLRQCELLDALCKQRYCVSVLARCVPHKVQTYLDRAHIGPVLGQSCGKSGLLFLKAAPEHCSRIASQPCWISISFQTRNRKKDATHKMYSTASVFNGAFKIDKGS